MNQKNINQICRVTTCKEKIYERGLCKEHETLALFLWMEEEGYHVMSGWIDYQESNCLIKDCHATTNPSQLFCKECAINCVKYFVDEANKRVLEYGLEVLFISEKPPFPAEWMLIPIGDLSAEIYYYSFRTRFCKEYFQAAKTKHFSCLACEQPATEQQTYFLCDDCAQTWRFVITHRKLPTNSYLVSLVENYHEKKKITKLLRNRMSKELKKLGKLQKGQLTSKGMVKLFGCTLEELVKHIEKQWYLRENGEFMTWENWGKEGWHIDHIKAINGGSINLLDDEDITNVCHYTNLRPLWREHNSSKRNDDNWIMPSVKYQKDLMFTPKHYQS